MTGFPRHTNKQINGTETHTHTTHTHTTHTHTHTHYTHHTKTSQPSKDSGHVSHYGGAHATLLLCHVYMRRAHKYNYKSCYNCLVALRNWTIKRTVIQLKIVFLRKQRKQQNLQWTTQAHKSIIAVFLHQYAVFPKVVSAQSCRLRVYTFWYPQMFTQM